MSNQAGKPLNVEALMPNWLSLDDFIIFTAMGAVFLIVYSIGQLFVNRDRMGPRLKAIAERRAELKSGLTDPKRRKKMKSQGGMEFIRNVVAQLFQSFGVIAAGRLQVIHAPPQLLAHPLDHP